MFAKKMMRGKMRELSLMGASDKTGEPIIHKDFKNAREEIPSILETVEVQKRNN